MAGEATALGDALTLALKRLGAGPRAGRLVVLLTDGRSNAGAVPPDLAARLAVELGVRVHTVGIGGEGEVAMATRSGGRALATERHDLDRETLAEIARRSGGRFFAARGSGDLGVVYEAIDRLERVEREARTPAPSAAEPGPALAAAGLLLALEILAARVLGRRIP
jgi:Ca-activated chloride channel family protein